MCMLMLNARHWTLVSWDLCFMFQVVCMPDSVLSGRKNGLTNSGFTPLPVPSSDVLTMQYIYAEPVYLVQVFDKQRSW